jgi:predicted nucleotidyltransferase
MPRSILADLEQLRRHIAPHVRRARTVIAFGSVARGNADDRSDLDLIIVADTARPFFERFEDFRGLYDVWPRLDLLIHTPDHVPTRYPNGLPGGVPAEVFTRRQPEEAVAIARRIVTFARGAIGP